MMPRPPAQSTELCLRVGLMTTKANNVRHEDLTKKVREHFVCLCVNKTHKHKEREREREREKERETLQWGAAAGT